MRSAVLAGLVLVATTPAVAQVPSAPATSASASQADLGRLRYQLRVMERVLEQAVQHGAQIISARLQAETPSMLLFAGPVRARGFWLEGYGIFFDVEVPALRESVTWSFRMLNRNGLGLGHALTLLRQHVESLGDASARNDLERALKRLEIQVGPMPDDRGGARTQTAAMEQPAAGTRAAQPGGDSPVLEDPVDTYTTEVKRALIEAILDYTGGLTLGADEWLTVAARDAEGQLVPGELSQATTILLRIKGGHLSDFRAGRLTRDEARKRVEVREF